jgi:hypothetical protein
MLFWMRITFLGFNHGRYCHELETRHSLELVWLKSFFFHQLKCWVNGAFMGADHFPQLYLNQGRDCHELKSMHSFKIVSKIIPPSWPSNRRSRTRNGFRYRSEPARRLSSKGSLLDSSYGEL